MGKARNQTPFLKKGMGFCFISGKAKGRGWVE